MKPTVGYVVVVAHQAPPGHAAGRRWERIDAYDDFEHALIARAAAEAACGVSCVIIAEPQDLDSHGDYHDTLHRLGAGSDG